MNEEKREGEKSKLGEFCQTMSAPNLQQRIADSMELYRIDLTADSKGLNLSLILDGRVARHEHIPWSDINKIKEAAIREEALIDYLKGRSEGN